MGFKIPACNFTQSLLLFLKYSKWWKANIISIQLIKYTDKIGVVGYEDDVELAVGGLDDGEEDVDQDEGE